MSEHFIRNIEIKNYKCFNDFKAEGFARVNLIGGKNNVGKTAFMEACYINTYPYKSKDNESMALSDIIFSRYNQVFLQDLLLEKGKKYVALAIEQKIKAFNEVEIASNIRTSNYRYKEGDLNIRDKQSLIKYFLGSQPITNDKLEESYGKIIELEMDQEIDELLKKFDPSLKSFRIINSEPKCNFIHNTTFIDIHELGDGLYKFLSFLFSMVICKNSYLYIDEIDTGIHYKNLDVLWELVIELAKRFNVQLFATTHSKECIESYAKVTKKLNDQDITFLDMGRKKDNSIAMITMSYDRFQEEVEMDNEVRGW